MDKRDKISTYFIFDYLVERAAILIAIVLASAIIKSNKGKSPLSPVCIIAEGSSFYKMKHFKLRVDYYLKNIISKRWNLYYEIQMVENAILLGAAVASL